MRLPSTAHTSRPWRIHELTHDFRLEDVWALPTPGGPGDFPALLEVFTSGDPAQRLRASRARSGRSGGSSASCSAGTVRTQVSAPGCRRSATGCRRICSTPHPGRTSTRSLSRSLYLLDDEFAAEVANRTMHGVMHLGWVPDGTGGYRGQMAVLVKPNGLFGSAYMAAIRPFRHRIVYPAMMRVDRAGLAGARGELAAAHV